MRTIPMSSAYRIKRQLPARVTKLMKALTDAAWLPGAPAHLDPATLAIDSGVCQNKVCAVCSGIGALYKPQRRGNAYRFLSECRRCGNTEIG